MNSIFYFYVFFTILAGSLYGDNANANDRPDSLPSTFRLIGNYQLNSKIRVERGEATPLVISPLRYQIYSDGIEVRLYYPSSDDFDCITFQIYRSDGIGITRKSGEINFVAGVQALNQRAGLIRQLSITNNSFTMVNVPPRSHRVLITRAFALEDATNLEHESSSAQ
ncbi:MAG: hypothetical protein ACPIA7_02075 [Akkermansiaceae bacterium]